jgi:hypothetical protein
MSQNLQDLFDSTHTNKFVDRSVKSAKWREAIASRYVDKPSPLKGRPGRKWTDEQKAAHAIRQQLEHQAGLRKTTKGTTLSDDHRAKLSQAAQNRSGPGNNAKRIHTPFGEFDSAKAAAEKLNVAYCSISRRMKKDPTNYYYL